MFCGTGAIPLIISKPDVVAQYGISHPGGQEGLRSLILQARQSWLSVEGGGDPSCGLVLGELSAQELVVGARCRLECRCWRLLCFPLLVT